MSQASTDCMQFPHSDLIAGYVTPDEHPGEEFGLRTSDGRVFLVKLTSMTGAQMVRNLGEGYDDRTAKMKAMLVPGRMVYAYGTFFPETSPPSFEAKMLTFSGTDHDNFAFERPNWWIDQVRELGDFYLKAQFPDGAADYRNYRTKIGLAGVKQNDNRQEVDTISRLTYGFASAYLLTGEDRFLDAAEKGTAYLREHLRAVDKAEGIVYWYHAIDVSGGDERKIFGSEFGDDLDAIPMYEQIYALAGPTQLYRITGDPLILEDIHGTIATFEKHYKDPEQGGYFSHVDPVRFDPRSEDLGANRARKNWNSVGDHAPAYLINAYLATGDQKLLDFLVETADTITAQFPDFDNSPFVQERFFEDWSKDQEWGWQQNRAVVGHNLKIAWNLMRINAIAPHDEYVALAQKIAEIMPAAGSDQQRHGWYDVVEREKAEGEAFHRFVWHDRKAWWQQEQAILAYLILHGILGDPEHLRLARESASFYNAFFLDHDDGGVYFNVLASGVPYLMGTERLKGSHSMANYHSSELCYLSATYINLLIRNEPLELHFKPKVGAFPDGILRVAPDLLPPGRVRLDEVLVDGEPYTDFDAEALTVTLPADREVKVKVRLVPTLDTFDARYELRDGVARITIRGILDEKGLDSLERQLSRAVADAATGVTLLASGLESLTSEGMRLLMFSRSKMSLSDASDFVVVGASQAVRDVITAAADLGAGDSDFTCIDSEA